jgi:ribonuclease HI
MEIIIYTDGSCTQKEDKCGYGIHFPNNEFKDISEPFNKLPKTSQRAELYGIYKSIKKVTKKNKNMNITIHTDSLYSINSITKWINNWKQNNWKSSTGKSIANQDIIKKIDTLIENHEGNIKFIHVRAHTNKNDYNSIHNDIADKLAKDGANKE